MLSLQPWKHRSKEVFQPCLTQGIIPVESGNDAARNGELEPAIHSILEEQKPEATYFIAEGGTRTGLVFLGLESAAGLPKIAEPWFPGLNARVELTPGVLLTS